MNHAPACFGYRRVQEDTLLQHWLGFRFVEGQTLLKRFKCSQPRIGLACGPLALHLFQNGFHLQEFLHGEAGQC